VGGNVGPGVGADPHVFFHTVNPLLPEKALQVEKLAHFRFLYTAKMQFTSERHAD